MSALGPDSLEGQDDGDSLAQVDSAPDFDLTADGPGHIAPEAKDPLALERALRDERERDDEHDELDRSSAAGTTDRDGW